MTIVTQGYGGGQLTPVVVTELVGVIEIVSLTGTIEEVTPTGTVEEIISLLGSIEENTLLSGIIEETTSLIGSLDDMPALQNISIHRGDDRTFKVTVKDENDAVVDITGASIIFSVKEKVGDSSYLFQRKNSVAGGGDSQILITDAANGEYEVYVVPANTADAELGIYQYDSELTTSGSKKYTVVRGDFDILSDITI